MSSGSLKDTVKALNATFSTASIALPLPEDLQTTLENYLDKHPDVEDSGSQRLQEELLTVFHKYVATKPDKHAPFIRALRQLRPAITGEARLLEWWQLIIRPSIDALGQKKKIIDEAKDFLLSVLAYDAEDRDVENKAALSRKFLSIVLDIYLDRARMPTADGAVKSPEDDYIAHDFESIFVSFARKKPKNLLLALDNLVVAKETRLRALSLLCAVVRFQPPHLYLVQETTLIEHLLKCLMIDTSTTAISLALTVLIMFLPHIPTSLVAHLPRLFLIYSRLLCWERFVSTPTGHEHQNSDSEEDGGEAQNGGLSSGWDKLESASDDTESTAPEMLHYFTFLYGLYPLNFMNYIRKPRKYLKSIDFPGADDFDLDQNLIRNRTEQYRQVHLMHPGFYTTTVEDELTDNRWIKADPSDVVMECMGLCIAIPPGLADPGPPPTSELPEVPGGSILTEDIPSQNLTVQNPGSPAASAGRVSPGGSRTNGSWRDTLSTAITSQSSYAMVEPVSSMRNDSDAFHSLPSQSSKTGSPESRFREYFDSPTLGPQVVAANANKPPAASTQTSPVAVSRKPVTPSDAASPRIDTIVQPRSTKRVSPPTSPTGNPASIAYLQREVMLLRNDLNFERYLKQQHLAHIGQLQSKNIREATAEAETQNLVQSNRALKSKLARANESYAALQKENVTGRSQAKKWEGELSSKVRSLREDQKHWKSDEEALKFDLQRAQKDCDALRKLVVEAESRDLLAQQKLRTMEQDLEDLDNLRRQVQEMRAKLRHYEARELEYERAKEDQEITRTELDTANLRLQSRDAERTRSKQAYERKIVELESRLRSAENPMPGQESPAAQQALEAALNDSQQRLVQLKKTYTRLLHRYTELEMRLQDLDESYTRNGLEDFASRVSEPLSPVAARRSSAGGSVGHASFSGSVGGFSSASRPGRTHAASDPTAMEDDEYVINLDHYAGPSGRSNTFGSVSSRPATLRSTGTGARNQSIGERTMSDTQETVLTSRTPTWEGDPVMSSSKSAWSAGSDNSKSDSAKIQPKSEVRVYGRGGAQNIGKKEKDEPKKKENKLPKIGGFRGMRGIM
ncbi:MAG: hypothetical protein M1820_008185 [Bogoriella megaspora]|nr:MAG: hypothetical protein M1820_008185 [Bogoriella megaspora]